MKIVFEICEIIEPTQKSAANRNQLVLIGRRLNEEEIEKEFLSGVF